MTLSTERHLEGLRIERNPFFVRLRQNTLQLAAGMNGEVNRAEAHQSEGGLAMAQFRLASFGGLPNPLPFTPMGGGRNEARGHDL